MPAHLTPRELEVLTLIARGMTTKELAFKMGITFKTGVCYRTRLLSKLNAHNAADLTRYAIESGLIASSASHSPTLAKAGDPSIERSIEKNRKAREDLRQALEAAKSIRQKALEAREELRDVSQQTVALCEELRSRSASGFGA